MTKKHFIAINNETGERIEFELGDIYVCINSFKDYYLGISGYPNYGVLRLQHYQGLEGMMYFLEILKNHTLYYLHQNKYYNYETQEEMG